jgi:hypothetical protein
VTCIPDPQPGHAGSHRTVLDSPHAGQQLNPELLGHAHIAVTAEVYAHLRLRLQRQAIEALGHALNDGDDIEALGHALNDGDDPDVPSPQRPPKCQQSEQHGAPHRHHGVGLLRQPPLPSALPPSQQWRLPAQTN